MPAVVTVILKTTELVKATLPHRVTLRLGHLMCECYWESDWGSIVGKISPTVECPYLNYFHQYIPVCSSRITVDLYQVSLTCLVPDRHRLGSMWSLKFPTFGGSLHFFPQPHLELAAVTVSHSTCT